MYFVTSFHFAAWDGVEDRLLQQMSDAAYGDQETFTGPRVIDVASSRVDRDSRPRTVDFDVMVSAADRSEATDVMLAAQERLCAAGSLTGMDCRVSSAMREMDAGRVGR